MPTLRYCLNEKKTSGCAQQACPAFCGPDINGICYRKGYGDEITNKLCNINNEYMCPKPTCNYLEQKIIYTKPVTKIPSLTETYSIFPYESKK